jgi:hypothetical protein
MEAPVNIALIKNPINWFIVILMVIFAIFIAEMIVMWIKGAPCACNSTKQESM